MGKLGKIPAVVQVFGPSLLGITAISLLTLFNTFTAELTQFRREVAAIHQQRMMSATVAEVDAELGTPDEPTAPAPPSPEPQRFAMR
jgi:hypothetical protein